jgi:hypothetical protein
LAAIAVARPQKPEELKYFANNAANCNPWRAGLETSMSGSSRVSPAATGFRQALTCRKKVKVGLTNTFGTVSARLEPLRVVASRRASVAPRGVTRHPSMDVKFGHTRPDRKPKHDPVGDKFNSRIMNAWRFNRTAGLTNGGAGSVVGAADLDPSGLSAIQRALVSIAQGKLCQIGMTRRARRNVLARLSHAVGPEGCLLIGKDRR